MLLVVGPFPPPTHGASRIAQMLVAELDRRKLPYRVVDTSSSRGGFGYHIARFGRNVRAVLQVSRSALTDRGVVVYQTGSGGAGIWYQVMIALLARLLRLRQSYHHHSFAYLSKSAASMRWLARCGGPRLCHIALSDSMARLLTEEYGCRRITVVSNAVLLGPARKRNPEPGAIYRIGHLSNLSLEKGVLHVLGVIARLREQGKSVEMSLAGPADSEEVKTAIFDHLRRHEQDIWLGPLEPDEVPEYMATLDCFLFPSTYVNEALPLVVLEALREGVPVVATPLGSLSELLEDTGWLASSELSDLVACVEQIQQNQDAHATAFDVYRRSYQIGSMDGLLAEMFAE